MSRIEINRNYYVLVKEWSYPTGPGREVFPGTFDSFGDALEMADSLCNKELANFSKACGCDPSEPDHLFSSVPAQDYPSGSVITPADGLPDWWYGVRIVCMKYGIGNWQT